jgi:hypothetical protein
MTATATRAAWAALAAGVALAGLEIGLAARSGAADDRVLRAPIHRVVIDASGGAVRLDPRARDVRVRVRRHHVVNTPSTSQHLAGGVLTLRTRCALSVLPCRSDYRVGVPHGVDVEVRKASGAVDARAIGGGRIDVDDVSRPLTVPTRTGTLSLVRRG